MKKKILNAIIIIVILLSTQKTIALGRLFMTAEQRIQLDHNKVDSEVLIQNEAIESQYLHLNGFVKPKHGASTIWVNGQIRETRPQANYYIRHSITAKNNVSVDLQGSRVELSPGQTLDIDNGIVVDAYNLKTTEKKVLGESTEEPSDNTGPETFIVEQ